MSEDLFSSSPMGGSQVPYKDMQAEATPQITPPSQPGAPATNAVPTAVQAAPNKNKKLLILGGGIAAGAVVLLLIIILVILATRNDTIIQIIKETPAPSATPAPDNSGLPQSISSQVDELGTEINAVDIKELEMSYPQLDWDIEY